MQLVLVLFFPLVLFVLVLVWRCFGLAGEIWGKGKTERVGSDGQHGEGGEGCARGRGRVGFDWRSGVETSVGIARA